MKKILLIFPLLLLLGKVGAQNHTITGNVTDEDGESIPGVNILEKGTISGTVSDLAGNFTITVKDGAEVLVFSFVGFLTDDVVIGARTFISHIMMQDVTMLSEVVVTALGVEREQKTLAYSVSEVAGQELTRSRDPNVMNQLAGRVAGVNVSKTSTGPSGSTRVVIRGNNSLVANNQPLYVIDGTPIDNSNLGSAGMWGGADSGDGVSSLNPDDIEKITVLKGAAAAALYGFRASNGVVLITTKSGSKRKGIGVEINSNFVVDEAISFTDWQTEYGLGSRGVKPVTLQEAQFYGDIAWGGKLDGSSVIQFDGVNRPYSYAGNAMDNFYETGSTFTNTLTLTGGGEMANFRFSASDLRNQSVIPNSGLDRNTYGTNINFKLDKFSASVSGTYVRQEMKNSPGISDFPYNANAIVRNIPSSLDIRTLKGDPEKLGADPVTGGEYLASSNIWWGNPYWTAHQVERMDAKNRIYGNIRLRYDLTDWLYVQGRIGLDSYNATRTHLVPTGHGFKPGGSLTLQTTRFEEINNDVIVGLNKELNNGIGINVLVGGSQLRIKREGEILSGSNFDIPFFHSYSNITNPGSSNFFSEQGVNSVYYQAEVSFYGIYLTTTGRQDWFSTTDGTGIFYPSIGVSAVLSDMFDVPAFDFLKVRGSWGEVGGGAPTPYGTSFNYSLDNPHNGLAIGGIAGRQIPNLALTPLTTSEYEVGLDARFLSGKLNVDLAYYSRKTVDDILGSFITPSSGYSSQLVNLGVLRGSGFELLITATPVRNSNFEWITAFNFGYNKSKVESLSDSGDPEERMIIAQSRTQTAFVGHQVGLPFGQIFGYNYDRDSSGNLVLNDIGLPVRNNELVPYGPGIAPTSGGWTNTLKYKNFSLNMLIDFKSGGFIHSGTNTVAYRMGMHQATLIGRETGIGEVFPENIQDYYHRIGAAITEDFVYKSDFVKLRELVISYNFPGSLIGKTPLRSLTLSMVGRNLWFLYKAADNIDPESTYNAGNNQGLEYGGYPSIRSFGFNLNAKF